jgi:hypothetical protein
LFASNPAVQGSRNFHSKNALRLPNIYVTTHGLVALTALAAFGCGLALAIGDLFFGVVFGAANAVATIEAIRRSR